MTQEIPFSLSDSAATRLGHLLKSEPAGARFRISVNGGGCSGFQYHFDFDSEPPTGDDLVMEQSGVPVVIDKTSLDFLSGAMLDYTETLGASSFEIKNPNATASCGCGNSFAV